MAFYNGSKLTPDGLGGLYVTTLDGKYKVPVKAIKLKNGAKATSTGVVQFSLKSIYGYKDLSYDDTWQTPNDAKAAYKTIKSAFKSAKSEVFTAYIAPSYIIDSISESALKTLKKAGKSLSASEIDKLVADWGIADLGANKTAVYIKTKNGTVKSAELVYVVSKYVQNKSGNGDVWKFKIKTKKFKKNKDYVIDNGGIKFDNLDTYTANGTIKAKT